MYIQNTNTNHDEIFSILSVVNISIAINLLSLLVTVFDNYKALFSGKQQNKWYKTNMDGKMRINSSKLKSLNKYSIKSIDDCLKYVINHSNVLANTNKQEICYEMEVYHISGHFFGFDKEIKIDFEILLRVYDIDKVAEYQEIFVNQLKQIGVEKSSMNQLMIQV